MFLRLQEASLLESRWTPDRCRQWLVIVRAVDNCERFPHQLSERDVALVGLRHQFSDSLKICSTTYIALV